MLKMKTAYQSFIVLALLCLCQQSSAHREDENIVQFRTIAIAPYGFERDSAAAGIYFDLANLLLREAGFRSEHHIYPYARIIHELKTGQTDLTIMFKYQELADHVIYIAPLPTLKNVVIGLKGEHFESISALRGKTLAYLRGANFSEQIDNDPLIVKHRTADFRQGIEMLARGRVDAVIGPIQPILSAAAAMDRINMLGEPLVVSERTPWLQISKKSVFSIFITEFENVFNSALRRGELKKLQQKYAPSNLETTQ
ncbi:MAG: transporter substrate-binding domain-containing protein [Pseudomonadales bacterium]|nr:transporter substrate-binding domain-containing protein [Pseudomonadales bacterium]